MKNIILSIIILLNVALLNAQVDRTKAPEPDQPKKLNVGVLIPIEMDNGLQVYLAPVKDYPKFTLSYSLEQPGYDEDERLEEKGILSKAYYAKKSKKFPNGEIDSIVNLKGAMLAIHNHGGTIKGMNRDIDMYLEMYADLLLNPIIEQEYIDEKAEAHAKSLEKKKEKSSIFSNKAFAAEKLLDSLLYGKVGVEEEEKEEIILNYDHIGIPEVEDFLEKRIVANNAVIVLVGDFTPKQVKKLMNKHLGHWPQGESYVHERDIKQYEPIIQNRKIIVLDKPNKVQANISFNWILRDAVMHGENSVKIEVLNEILGESQLSYLYKNIREDKSLCYFIRSSITPDDNGGRATIGTQVRTDQVGLAVENIILEMLRIRNFDVSEEDLKVAKSSLIGEFTRSLSGIAPIPYISFAMIKETYELPDDYLQTRVSEYYKVTIEDVREMAEKYVNPFEAVIIVKGNAKELHGQLERFGEVTYFDEEGNELDFTK